MPETIPVEPGRARSHSFSPHPIKPRLGAGSMFGAHKLLHRNFVWNGFAGLVENVAPLYRIFTWAEEKTKRWAFGCRMCAQCALPATAYACPQTCPKQLRNGPCGGVFPDGRCEVYPDQRCVWVIAYERAEAAGHVKDLRQLVRPIDHRRWGQSSWINYWRGRDEELWTHEDSLDARETPSL